MPEPSPLFWQHFSERVRTAIDAEARAGGDWPPRGCAGRCSLPLGGAGDDRRSALMIARADADAPSGARRSLHVDDCAADGDSTRAGDDSWVVVAELVGDARSQTRRSAAGVVVEPGAAEQAVLQLTRGRTAGTDAPAQGRIDASEVMKTTACCHRACWFCVASPAMARSQRIHAPQGGGPLPGLDNGDMTPGEIQKLFDA